MAFPDDFIPELWSGALLDTLDKNLILTGLTNNRHAGLVQNQGDTVHIQKFTNLTAGTYSGTVTYEAEASSTVTLSLNQDKYVATSLDSKNILQAQSDVSLIQGYTDRIFYGLADDIDTYIGSLYAQSTLTAITWDVGTTDPWDAVLTEAAEQLNAANVPQEGRWIVVRPAGLSALQRSADFQRASDLGDQILQTGAIGMAAGFRVHMSNNLANTTGNFYQYLYGHPMAITHAIQMAPGVQAIDRDAAFETGLRARIVYGAVAEQTTAFGNIIADET